MPGLVPGIHVFLSGKSASEAWMAGTSPAMAGGATLPDYFPLFS
jgi:hypothetical protein